MSSKNVLYRSLLCALLATYAVHATPAFSAAQNRSTQSVAATSKASQHFAKLADRYYEEGARFEPLQATFNGDNRFDDQLGMAIAAPVRAKHFAFLHQVQTQLQRIARANLSAADQLSYDCLSAELQKSLAFEPFPEHLLPIAQMDSLAEASLEKSDFYAPIRNLPITFSQSDKAQLTQAYKHTITKQILPALKDFTVFLEKDYLPASRATAGLGALPNGSAWYKAAIQVQTTTGLSADDIHQIGLDEVKRIHDEMAKLGQKLGYSGRAVGVYNWLTEQAQNRPYKTEEDVLQGYRDINRKIIPKLPELFVSIPKAALAIKAEPEITRATASDHYDAPSVDGSRPGIYWAVVDDPLTYSTTHMTSLFLHEGQPGHHFQLAAQQQLQVPKFRKFGGNNAYVEGWALYAETLGKEMGLYEDANAYAGFLRMELSRAARLVVDTGLHAKGWSREQTIAYLQENVGASVEGATNATERYMVWPGQALAYKIGSLKIMQLRQQAEQALGTGFKLARFHDAILADGALPLSLLEVKMTQWIAAEAKGGLSAKAGS
ncbi:MAG: DUF885 domain-containing protein [Burkholderiales bacterium]|nr:DUF885 domain-containing protein [Burkholderiales bacterium]